MAARDAQARAAGFLYLTMSVASTIGLSIIPSWSTSGRALQGALAKIAASPFQYRVGILSEHASQILFVALVLALYDLLEGVDRRLARLMVALVLVQVPMSFANLLLGVAPLALQSGADYLAAFSREKLDLLSAAALQVRGYGVKLIMVLWGLWLLPLGLLVYRCGFIPRLFGVLLVLGCVGHNAVGVTALLFPEREPAVARLTLLALGEVLIALWLLLKGAPLTAQERRAAQEGVGPVRA